MSQEPRLPSWADELKVRYVSGEASMFLLHGNVRDLQPWQSQDGRTEYLPLRSFLERFLSRTKTPVVYYNVSEGLEFPSRKHEQKFRTVVDARRMLGGESALGTLPRGAGKVLPIIEDLITEPDTDMGKQIAAQPDRWTEVFRTSDTIVRIYKWKGGGPPPGWQTRRRSM